MIDDAQLLRSYVASRSESAFRGLVERHLGLVYSAAVRQLGAQGHLAEDVAQEVFLLLAEKAGGLLGHSSLAGWLHQVTHYKAAHALRAEARRRARESESAFMSEATREAPTEWNRIRPVLDRALLELKSIDREAILLRFFENRSFAEIAAQLSLTEATAHKRVARALEKLRAGLARNGAASSVATLSLALEANGAIAVPAGLSATVSGTVAGTVFSAPASAAVLFMSAKSTMFAAGFLALVIGGIAGYEIVRTQQREQQVTDVNRTADDWALKTRAEETIAQRLIPSPKAAAKAAPRPAATFFAPDEGRAFLEAHPAVRAAFEAYYRKQIRAEYGQVIATMGLTEAEAQRFIGLLTLLRSELVGGYLLGLDDGSVPADQVAGKLKELLGVQRYQQYRDFERSAPARNLRDEMVKSLYATSSPLTAEQMEALQQLTVQALRQAKLDARSAPSNWDSLPPPVWDSVLAGAGAVLSGPQLDALRDLAAAAAYHRKYTHASMSFSQER